MKQAAHVGGNCYKVFFSPDHKKLQPLPVVMERGIFYEFVPNEVTHTVDTGPFSAWETEMQARLNFFKQLEQSIRLKSQIWECECLLSQFNGKVPKIVSFNLLNQKQAENFWSKIAPLAADPKALYKYYHEKDAAYKKHKKTHTVNAFMTVEKGTVFCHWVKPIKRVE